MNTIGLYVHIPFCRSKCPYCDFYSLPVGRCSGGAQPWQPYLDSLHRCIAGAPCAGRVADSVYFGGGTPSLLGEQLLPVLRALADRYPLAPNCEITLEANPATLEAKTLAQLRQGGINRLSLGVQASQDSQLRQLGRLHSFSQAVQAVREARQAGFSNLSVDLMLGTPGQDTGSVDRFVETFAGEGVSHISAYLLTVEEGTPFARQGIQALCPDEEDSARLYLHAVEALGRAGFVQYEISNFSKPGRESRHNLRYWDCREYLGFGPSAHSFWEGRRYRFPRNLDAFCQAENPWQLLEPEEGGGDFFEYAMLRLRLTQGLVLEQARRRFPGQELEPLLEQARRLASHRLVCLDGERVWLTTQGFLVSNGVIGRLLEGC